MADQRRVSRKAIWCMILGLCAFVGSILGFAPLLVRSVDEAWFLPIAGPIGCLGLASIILNFTADKEIRTSNGAVRGSGYQLAGGFAAAATVIYVGFVLPALNMLITAADRMRTAVALRELAAAMRQFDSEHGHLPAHAICDKNGKPLLSWRVAILPYLGEKKLYDEFHLDESWDSAHNRTLLPRMPKLFQHPWDRWPKEVGQTYFQVFKGKGSPFDGEKLVSLKQIAAADGWSDTILIVEAHDPVPWTKPADIPVEGDLFPRLGLAYLDRANVVFANGTVRCVGRHLGRLPPDLSIDREKLLRQLITWDGGEKEDVTGIVD